MNLQLEATIIWKIGKITLNLVFLICFTCQHLYAQKVAFVEYNLTNGLHVILHKDTSIPVITVSVMYHVGSKNEMANRTGFAHFFEHLLFEGTENIKRGDFTKIVASNGGKNNANTTQDRTFFYEIFPSDQLELGLWLESERMFHPVISDAGVANQKEVVKEEKRQRIDNQSYGHFQEAIFNELFSSHPYHWQPIGSMKDLDSAKLKEFRAFFQKYYVPNNAVLCITGNININSTKSLVREYFGPIPKGREVFYKKIKEVAINQEKIDTVYDSNIQLPAIAAAFRIPGGNTRQAAVFEMISSILSEGQSSRMYKKMVDERGSALQVIAFKITLEDYGVYVIGAIPNNGVALSDLLNSINKEIKKLQSDLITETEYIKIQNQFENDYLNTNTYLLGVAENLSNGYLLYKNTNHINEELDLVRSITREEIRESARKYLKSNQRVVLYYLPHQKPAARELK